MNRESSSNIALLPAASEKDALAIEKISSFDQWMDEQLAELEAQHASSTTRHSLLVSLSR